MTSGPVIEWDAGNLQVYMDANDASSLEASRLNDFVSIVLGVTFPVDISL